jgi:hypothetical protein
MLLSVGLYNEENKNCGLENYELTLKIFNSGFIGKHIKKNLFFYRRHDNNLSAKNFKSIVNYGSNLAKQYGLDFYTINQYHTYININDINTVDIKYVTYKK